jgi:hypothetical protein
MPKSKHGANGKPAKKSARAPAKKTAKPEKSSEQKPEENWFEEMDPTGIHYVIPWGGPQFWREKPKP